MTSKQIENIPLLELKNVSKSFGANKVLKDVSFSLHKGEIFGLVGENGAGKSTLMKILFGMPDITQTGGYQGDVFFQGVRTTFQEPIEAIDAGIGMVHQEFSLIPGFTTTENLFINRELTKRTLMSEIFGDSLNVLDKKRMETRAQKAIDTLGVKLNTDTKVVDMSVGFKQFTEIAREIEKDQTKLLVLDEPTAVLTETESELLILAIKNLAAQGIAVIFISHRLHEIGDLCDRVLVLRDGAITLNKKSSDVDIHEISHAMIGREIKQTDNHVRNFSHAETILDIKNLWVNMPGEKVRKVNLEVKKGEILGLAGMAGQGKLGIPCGVMGIEAAGGNVLYKGEPLVLNSPFISQKKGLAFVSEDRRNIGLLLEEDIAHNMVMPAMIIKNQYVKKMFGFLPQKDMKKILSVANKMINEFKIKCVGPKQLSKELSGGNQQKICLAKTFLLEPDLLFVSEPTRGIDIAAKAIVLEKLRSYSEEMGATIVVCSSELEELRSLCDRIAVVNEGEITGILAADEHIDRFGELMITL